MHCLNESSIYNDITILYSAHVYCRFEVLKCSVLRKTSQLWMGSDPHPLNRGILYLDSTAGFAADPHYYSQNVQYLIFLTMLAVLSLTV